MSALHTPAGHRCSLMWASYSERKYRSVESTGFGAVCPRPHREAFLIEVAHLWRLSMSESLPFPSQILVKVSSIFRVPTRQGGHLPQDSSWQKSMKNRATSTMHFESSMTIIPPEPTIAPSCMIAS